MLFLWHVNTFDIFSLQIKLFRTLQDIPLKRTLGLHFISLWAWFWIFKKSQVFYLSLTEDSLKSGETTTAYICQLCQAFFLMIFNSSWAFFNSTQMFVWFSINLHFLYYYFTSFQLLLNYFQYFHLKGIISGLLSKHQLGPLLFQIPA